MQENKKSKDGMGFSDDRIERIEDRREGIVKME